MVLVVSFIVLTISDCSVVQTALVTCSSSPFMRRSVYYGCFGRFVMVVSVDNFWLHS